jgi:glycine hydroxymethyltransferase
MKALQAVDLEIFDAIAKERGRQEDHLELIASENFTSQAVLDAAGSILTNKYAEGYPGRRYYGGCEFVDRVERIAIERAKKLFSAEHVNVQPHSGTQANIAVYTSVLKPGDKILTMSLSEGGHLTHGHTKNLSGMLYSVVHYGLDAKTMRIDYGAMDRLAAAEKPKLITIGASAYPREIDFKLVAEIAHAHGALVMADIAHIAGLVVAGLHQSPVPHCDFVTSTTHKTLRGPRGGLIICKQNFAKAIDSSLFPGNQGGPLMHIIAAKAVCFLEALQPSFAEYQKKIINNARTLAQTFIDLGMDLVSGGTDNHLMLLDLRKSFPQMTGQKAQEILGKSNITLNKNTIPGETRSPVETSGLRIGTPAVTSRGMGEAEMRKIAKWIQELLTAHDVDHKISQVRDLVVSLCREFPLPYDCYETK